MTQESTIQLILGLRGGAGPKPAQEMSVAAGGKIKQVIHRNAQGSDWLPDKTTVVSVQIFNSASYHAVTGEEPPTKPISAEKHKEYGYPFFKMYEEPSGVSGDFSKVKSVAEIEKRSDAKVVPRVVKPGGHKMVKRGVDIGVANPYGPLRPFRTVADLEEEMAKCDISDV
jgi:hypothetical protein